MIQLNLYADEVGTSRALIDKILQIAGTYPTDQQLNIAISGGNTPALMFRLWAEEKGDVTPWRRLRFFWVDERCVPPSDPQSNYRMTKENLLSRIAIPADNVMRIMGENDPETEAKRYEDIVRSKVPCEDGIPQFDMVMLGAGDDGHTSSIFPGQEHLLTAPVAYAVGTQPATRQQRVALTGLPLVHASHLFFLVTGEKKAQVVADIMDSQDHGPASYVAHHALHHVELFTDQKVK